MTRPRRQRRGVLVCCLMAAALCGCAPAPSRTVDAPPEEADTGAQVVARANQLRTFPCVEQCHAEEEVGPGDYDLDAFHTLRTLRHGPSMFGCSFCHRPKNLDDLQLLDSSAVSMDEAHRVCGQCHGEILREWVAGIHGLTTGSFRGGGLRRSCPFCHDPHAPQRPRFEALPRPRQPLERAGEEEEAHHG